MNLPHRRSNRLMRKSKSPVRRKVIFESLEDRRLLTASFGGEIISHMDVNRDGSVTAVDALQVINVLEIKRVAPDSSPPAIEPRHDINSDGDVTAVDVLQIVSYLNGEGDGSVTQSLQSEPEPTASISLPSQIRSRDIAELTIDSISNLDLSTVDHLEIDWGDGRVTHIEDGFSLPLSLLHSYYIDPTSVLVEVRAEPLSGPPIVLESGTIELIANSPSIIDRVDDGLTAKIFDNATFTGPSVRVRTDPTIDFDFGMGAPDPNLNIGTSPFSVRWQGTFVPKQTATHTFFALVGVNDTADVYLDNQLLFTASDGEQSATIALTEGQIVDVKVEYVAGAGVSRIRVGSETDSTFKTALPSNQLTPLVPASQLRSGVLAETFETIAPGSPLTSVAELRSHDAFIANLPSAASDLSSFSYAGVPGERASRIRGIVSPPVSGHYTFRLATSDEAELWLSQGVTSDTSRLIASVATPTPAEDFTDPNAGVSASVYMVAGQDYYFETLLVHDDPVAADHLSVAWTRPDQIATGPQLISNEFLRPIVPQVSLLADVSQTNEFFASDSTIRFVAVRDDDFGRDLPVAYTIGGTSGNGSDYPLQTGTVVIPAGQRSAEIEFIATKDGVAEPSETIVVRLVADPTYQLGSESTRQVIGTIIGEVMGGTELLPPDSILMSSYHFFNASAPNSVVEFEETDASLPFVDAATGNNAIRVELNSFTDPWDIAFTHRILPSVLFEDDKLFASAWARSANIDGSPATVGMRLQENDNYHGEEQTWEVSDEWTPLLWPLIADFDGNVTANRSLDIRLGYQQQSVELAGLSLLKLPASTDMNSLPRTIFSYDGRDADAVWRSQAQIDEQTQRSHPVQITIQDAAGSPIEGAVVTITPLAPSLKLGMQASPARVVLSDDPYSQTADSSRYRAIIETYFDTLTDGGEAQWGPWEEDPQLPTDFLQWVVDRDYSYHGHAIVWGEMDRFPAPDDLLSDYQQVETAVGSEAAKTWLENEVLTHIATGPASAFSGTRVGSNEPLATWWDVINHPILSSDIWDIVGDDFMLDVINAARSAVHPDTRLIINEFDVLSNPDEGQSDEFFNLLTYLDTQSPGGRADYDTIGFQSHFRSHRLPAIDRIVTELERYQELQRDFHITEFDVDALFIDEQTQADFTRDFYRALAANESVSVFTTWGFWEGDHWRSEEEAALFNQDWTPKPNGQWLLDQQPVSHSATTTGVPLLMSLNGQSYSVQVLANQFDHNFNVELGSGPVVITIDTPPIEDQPQFVVNTIADTPDANLGDGFALDANGMTSLRAAIQEANAIANLTGTLDTIAFDIPGTGPHVISLTTQLPAIGNPILINGTSEPDYAGVPVVQIDGGGTLDRGLQVIAGAVGSAIVGLSVTGFDEAGIELTNTSSVSLSDNYLGVDLAGTAAPNFDGLRIINATDNLIDGNVISGNNRAGGFVLTTTPGNNTFSNNWIGTNPVGSLATGNLVYGLVLSSPDNVAQDNTISGNTTAGVLVTSHDNVLLGNRIGTNALGTAAITGQSFGVVLRGFENQIGGNGPGDLNVISGNTSSGVYLLGTSSQDNVLTGNHIGVNLDGDAAIPNGSHGVFISGGSDNQIGGSLPGQANVISGNSVSGVFIIGADSTGNTLHGNLIGLDHSGTMALPNLFHGVHVKDAADNFIGGAQSGEGNVISGNAMSGVIVVGRPSTGNQITGNTIGLTGDGMSALGNAVIGIQVVFSAQSNEVRDNLIAGNGGTQIGIRGGITSFNTIAGNHIGFASDLTTRIDAGFQGILLSSPSNTIGGPNAQDANVITGSVNGLNLTGSNAKNNLVQGNIFGTNVNSDGPQYGMSHGIRISDQAKDNQIGPDNTIAFSTARGIFVTSLGNGNQITRNEIFSNVDGIKLSGPASSSTDSGDGDEGPNRLQNTATSLVVDATTNGFNDDVDIQFDYQVDTLTSNAAYPLTVEFFLSDSSGQGIHYLTSDTYTTPGTKSFSQTFDSSMFPFTPDFGTATVTDATGNTSEFAVAVPVSINHGGSGEPLAALPPTPAAAFDPMDVNRDRQITSLDALQVINEINKFASNGEPVANATDATYLDVNRDGSVTALDALMIINRLNEGESDLEDTLSDAAQDAFFASLEDDDFGRMDDLLDPLLF